MNEFELLAKNTVRITAFVVAISAALWALLPSVRPVFAGLTIGSVVSLYFAISAIKQTEMVADVALRNARKRPSYIMVFRIIMIMAAVVAARVLEKRLGYVSLPSMVIGFFVYQLVILGGFLYNKLKTS